MSIGVILHEPEQPGNTGAIGRTCICAKTHLHRCRCVFEPYPAARVSDR